MLDYQRNAINRIREYAKERDAADMLYVKRFCKESGVDAGMLIQQVKERPVTINFHPDRFSGNGKTIMENLMEQGQYHGQFRTKTSNGGKTAYVGGERFLWEQRLFFDAYPEQSAERPKYGALNLLQYIDGASVRFGSCFFVLKHTILNRCTFSYGDSSTNPSALCTSDVFAGIVAGLLRDVLEHGRLLNQVAASKPEVLAVLLYSQKEPKYFGKNLDYCIETHIHGDISLQEDVESFYLDASFKDTVFEKQAIELCGKYGIALHLIPKREITIGTIGELFRGPMIRPLAEKIDNLFGGNRGVMNAALVGQASRNSILHPEAWKEFGEGEEIFQYFKQLWHTVGYFG